MQPDSTNQKLRDWQSRMNWTSDAERNLFLLACICCLLLPPLGISTLGLLPSMLLLASHLVLLLYCATCVKRRFAIASNVIVITSLVNFLLAQYSGLEHPELLVYLFCILALLSLPFGIRGFVLAQSRSRSALSLTERDEFRWLLTEAPLLVRWRFMELLREQGILQ